MAAAPEREEDLAASFFQTTISLKITRIYMPWWQMADYLNLFALSPVAAAVVGGAQILNMLGNSNVEDAIRRALEGPGLQVRAEALVRDIEQPHSILVELDCDRKTSFQSFMKDFETGKVNQRVNEELKKIGRKEKYEVTIMNDKEVNKKRDEIRVWSHPIPAKEDAAETASASETYPVQKILVHGQNGLAKLRKTLVDDEARPVDEPQRALREQQQQQARAAVEEDISQEKIGYTKLEERLQNEKLSYQSIQQDLQSEENVIREQKRHLKEENQKKTALEERLRRLEQRIEEERNSYLSTERELRSAVSAADHRLQEENKQKTALEESLRNLEQRMEEERNSHLSTERELRSAVSAAGHRLQEENQQKTALEERLRSLEQRMEVERNSHLYTERELRSAVSAAENALAEYMRHQSRDWIIQREEVVLNEKILGKGAWGNVRVGKFRGCQVAVKEIHDLILSDYNRELFEREMSIASRCRHPNLLQFIGATNDEGSPLFVAELLDTSLRNVLHQRALNHGEIVILALDVAKGLNYLHLSTPLPIMHRDISSANVLLWRRDESWRAKLSDYGSANFLRQSMTVNPGALIYSAPEAFTSRQSTKVDVYSFGVLLCEMCIRKQPDPQNLHNQISRVNQDALRGLIQRCVETDPEARPTMSEVIHELEQFV